MGNTNGSKNPGEHTMNFFNTEPFNIQIPLSLRDPRETTFSIQQLEQLKIVDDARNIALGYIHDFNKFASVWNSNKIHPETRRLLRKLVQIQTINAVCNGFYRLPDSTRIDLDIDTMTHAAENTKMYSNNYEYDASRQQRSYDQPAKIFVVNGDCLDTVMHFKEKYSDCNPVVLNMAAANCPGGGCGAQEENLHRRTNLFQCLEDSYHQLEGKRNWHYPIPEFGGIYSPHVSVFRGSESHGYPFFSQRPQYVSFIACAAYSHPYTSRNKDGEMELYGQDVINNTMKKMETIFKIALENEHDTVILSAFGCGAFRNPPRHIAKLFHTVISKEYSHAFKYIIFTIMDDHNSMKDHNPNGNIQPFADIFNIYIIIMSAFVELLRKSNLDYIVARKPFKIGSRSDDVIFASFIDVKTKRLQLVACLDKPELVTVWSTSLDERSFQLNARLLDISELGETMNFLCERINESDFTLAKAASTNSDGQYEVSQVNVTFTHPKNKQSITLQLYEHVDEGEKSSFLSKILLHVYKRNEQLTAEVKTQQLRIKELSTKAQRAQPRSIGGNRSFDGNRSMDSNNQKGNMNKPHGNIQMSLINPTVKRRKAPTGVNYDDEESD
ncbi:unnamed protein product [Rotaria sp. Silwood2]|nr:unnamed protein product [Rotaria sp. Silwood2]CAF2581335.1 unnamed protein product [Rotaria sp. Silwood2]CAF2989104.1 unnamed protein product [Rotaria sp. Silwood2]CAF3977129.1 unnamed protein product [Rotaria sp. Silwood2]CAF4057706.1 unnamed protein product [Rotaria sp. Silwood2]